MDCFLFLVFNLNGIRVAQPHVPLMCECCYYATQYVRYSGHINR